MHEASIVSSLIDLIREHVPADQNMRVKNVLLKVGILSGVEPAALQFAWRAAIEGSNLADSALSIEQVEIVILCAGCGAQSVISRLGELRCTKCAQWSNDVVSGKELDLISIELFDG